MPLPLCECVNGLPTQQQLGFIYCALLEILAGQGGGTITLSQISDLDGSWITPLQAPISTVGENLVSLANPAETGVVQISDTGVVTILPPGDLADFVQGEIEIGVNQITGATPQAQNFITTLPAGDAGGSVVVIDDTGTAGVVTGNTNAGPITSVDSVDRGVVTATT